VVLLYPVWLVFYEEVLLPRTGYLEKMDAIVQDPDFLDMCLQDPVLFPSLSDWTVSSWCSENLLFYIEVASHSFPFFAAFSQRKRAKINLKKKKKVHKFGQEYPEMEQDERLDKVQFIWETYLQPFSPFEVNVSEGIREMVHERFFFPFSFCPVLFVVSCCLKIYVNLQDQPK